MINKVGIELEGGWENHPADWKGSKTYIIQDLSIDGRTMANDGRLTTQHVGEIVSPPLSLNEWEDWVKAYYPDKVNNTCGLHVHVSFTKKKDYGLLMAKSYERAVIAAAKTLAGGLNLPDGHYIWPRLEGRNVFATFNSNPIHQVNIRVKRIGMRDRYSAFNFCFSMHGTLEYRALPMFKEGAAIASRFISNFLLTTEEELEKRKEISLDLRCSLREKNNVIEEREVL
jgi:hypothetical protein